MPIWNLIIKLVNHPNLDIESAEIQTIKGKSKIQKIKPTAGQANTEPLKFLYYIAVKQAGLSCAKLRLRHEILYISSSNKNPQSTGFCKISSIFTLFTSIFYVIIALNMMKMPNKAE